jgi:hypothetical protein
LAQAIKSTSPTAPARISSAERKFCASELKYRLGYTGMRPGR